MAVLSATELRSILIRELPSVNELETHQRFAVLASSSWIDEVINDRVDLIAYIGEYAVNGKIRVEVAYRSSGWGGIDDACTHHYTLNASVREYMDFCRELRRDCDGCDASVGLVHFN